MEWRHIYNRAEIWRMRSSYWNECFQLPFKNEFLNEYQQKCIQISQAPPPVWATPTFEHPPWVVQKKNKPKGQSMNQAIWRNSKEENTTGDFKKFANQAWQPQTISNFYIILRELRTIFNKWTQKNYNQILDELNQWWNHRAIGFGIWRSFFVLSEWLNKLMNERLVNLKWFETIMNTFLSLSWSMEAIEPTMENDLMEAIHNHHFTRIHLVDSWNYFRSQNKNTTVCWKYWIAYALETEAKQVIITPVWCNFLSVLWLNGTLPMSFLPWMMFTLPNTIQESKSWEWRLHLWEAMETTYKSKQILILQKNIICWNQWKQAFQKHALQVYTINFTEWSSFLKVKWSTICPEWNFGSLKQIQQESIPEIKPKLTNQTMDLNHENVRCMFREWKEMGYQGWMDSYLPEWIFQENPEQKNNWKLWMDLFFYEADQILGISIWNKHEWQLFILWMIQQQSILYQSWIPELLDEWNMEPPEWTIECPQFKQNIDLLRQWYNEKNKCK